MHLCQPLAVLLLALMAGNGAAQNGSSATSGALPVPANRIVGLWQVPVTVGACGRAPETFLALANYHAGGTLSDTNKNAPTTRWPGLGIWRHQGKGLYKTRFQFMRYLPGQMASASRSTSNRTLCPATLRPIRGILRSARLGPDFTGDLTSCSHTASRVVGAAP